MHNYLSKSLLDDNDLKIDECVILGSKSFHMKLQPEEGTIGLYVVSGCATVYEFDINLVITIVINIIIDLIIIGLFI